MEMEVVGGYVMANGVALSEAKIERRTIVFALEHLLQPREEAVFGDVVKRILLAKTQDGGQQDCCAVVKDIDHDLVIRDLVQLGLSGSFLLGKGRQALHTVIIEIQDGEVIKRDEISVSALLLLPQADVYVVMSLED